MKPQWECFLNNIGEWHGSFTRVSLEGEILEDTPSILLLESLNDDRDARLTLRRFPGGEVNEMVLEYNPSSMARKVLFFETGAFSQGSLQWAPFTQFGAELALVDRNRSRRLRLVQLFDRESQLNLTLIREKLAGTNTPESPILTVEDLLGEWQGEAITIYPDAQTPDTYPTNMKLRQEGAELLQELTFGSGTSTRTITSQAKIDGKVLHFDRGALPVRVLLLPDGASATFPFKINSRTPFFLEAGWLLQPNLRQRMIRSYNETGEWVSLTLVTERKQE
ncbi:MAG: DUF3598 family protein [Cyanosarcina radialis HA8281-LM2]|jgi:hypothetical protein|nr:DUF3598 family protein [Cyanosarcina radialis HA8281-LM2]